MDRRTGIAWIFAVFVVAVTLFAGCISPSFFSQTTTPTPTPLPASPGTAQPAGDTAFLALQQASDADIASSLQAMNTLFPTGAALLKVPYSPSRLQSAAMNTKATADGYHKAMIQLKNFAQKENELKRNEYLKYLFTIGKVGGDIADAGHAEMNQQFGLAQTYAESAQQSLRSVEGVPSPLHQELLTTTRIYLDDYIQKMRERRV